MEEALQDTRTDSRGSAGARGFAALPDALLRYLEARGVLLTIEGREAAQQLLCVVFRGVLAAILGFTGWLLLMVAVTGYLAASRGWSWPQVAAAVGLANLVLAIAFASAASRRISSARWFEHTLSEFEKDRAWLGQLNDRH